MTATLIPTATPAAVSTTAAAIARGRRIRRRRWTVITAILAVIVLAVVAISTMVGHTFYTPVDVVRVILGETVPGASFTVGELRPSHRRTASSMLRCERLSTSERSSSRHAPTPYSTARWPRACRGRRHSARGPPNRDGLRPGASPRA